MKDRRSFLEKLRDIFIYEEVYNKELHNEKGIIAYDLYIRKIYFFLFKSESKKIGAIYYNPGRCRYSIEIDKFDSIKEYNTPKINHPADLFKTSIVIAFKGSKEIIDIKRSHIPNFYNKNTRVNLDIGEITDKAIDFYFKEEK